MAFEQDDYDKKFVRKVNWLIATKDDHKLFKRADDLVKVFDLSGKNVLSSIRNGRVHVPMSKRDLIDKKIAELMQAATKKVPLQFTLNEPEQPAYGITPLKALSEDVKSLKISLDLVLSNQRVMLAHISADSVMAAARHVGDDPQRLSAELRKRDKLIGVALEKDS